jgi:hypothetical protein
MRRLLADFMATADSGAPMVRQGEGFGPALVRFTPNYLGGVLMARGVSETLRTELPAKFDRLFPWADLDRRCSAVREFAGDLTELWQDLGGVEHLSVQKRWLCERVVYMRRRMLAYESVVLSLATLPAGAEPPKLPMDAGTYSNFANVVQGHLRTLGIERQSRPVKSLRAHLESVS